MADELNVVFSRLQDGRTRVAVKKAATRTFAGAADLGVSVTLAEPQQLELAVREAVAGLLGEDYATVRALVEKASLAELSEVERWAAEGLATRLGLGELLSAFTTLREKLRQIEGALAEAVADLATEKIAAGFAYEYRRLGRGSTLLEVVLDAGAAGHPSRLAVQRRPRVGRRGGPRGLPGAHPRGLPAPEDAGEGAKLGLHARRGPVGRKG